jgi:2,4-dienoyl-CoA reductase-like NADH-dependent reductase (Old Yellow Enzyme family)
MYIIKNRKKNHIFQDTEWSSMAELFDITSIGTMTMRNRFVRSATGTRMAQADGGMTSKLTKHIMDLVDGGVGLVISGHAYVHPDGQASPRQLGIYSDMLVPGLTAFVKTVHEHHGTIVAQLTHGGAHSNPELTGVEAMAPSALPAQEGKRVVFPGCRAMTQKDIIRVVDAFHAAARRAYEAGFDGIQLHGAHGYLLSEFLSPFYNKRSDDYGGSFRNRARIVLDTYHAVRDAVGDHFPVMIKMNVIDLLPNGLSVDEGREAASLYESVGFDAIELSGGTSWGTLVLGDPHRAICRNDPHEAYYRDTAHHLTSTLKKPIILTGGIKSYHVAAQLIQNNIADYIGLCRPLIREPNLVNRWKSGAWRKSECVSDNACLFRRDGMDLQCFHV